MNQAANTNHIEQVICPLQETGPGNLRNSEGAVIELRDGRLFLAYTHFYADADDFGAADIRGKFSEDGGRTWSKPFIVQSNTAKYNTGRLALLRARPVSPISATPTASLLSLIYVNQNDFYENQLYWTTSIDEGKNWSTRIPINDVGTLGHVCQRGDTALVLRSGRILVPVYAMFGGMCASFMYYSDDGGNTWQRSHGEISIRLCEGKHTVGYAEFEEPAVVELRDGRLLCFGRTRMGQIYQSVSSDGGRTWSEVGPTGLASSYSPCSLKIVPSTGDILCIWNQVSAQEIADGLGRMRLSCAISKDDGKTWTHFQNLESLDDQTRIEPEGKSVDAITELNAVRQRRALKAQGTKTLYPQEVTKRYPRWPGYINNDYPAVTFTSTGHVVIIYGASDYETAGLTVGLKLIVCPIEWLYGPRA